MHARAAVGSVDAGVAAQPTNSSAEALVNAANEINEEFFTSLPFYGVRVNSSGTTVLVERWLAHPDPVQGAEMTKLRSEL